MAWKDRLLRASFRGVEFGIESHDTQAAGQACGDPRISDAGPSTG